LYALFSQNAKAAANVAVEIRERQSPDWRAAKRLSGEWRSQGEVIRRFFAHPEGFFSQGTETNPVGSEYFSQVPATFPRNPSSIQYIKAVRFGFPPTGRTKK
jgi:hypothetical protein